MPGAGFSGGGQGEVGAVAHGILWAARVSETTRDDNYAHHNGQRRATASSGNEHALRAHSARRCAPESFVVPARRVSLRKPDKTGTTHTHNVPSITNDARIGGKARASTAA